MFMCANHRDSILKADPARNEFKIPEIIVSLASILSNPLQYCLMQSLPVLSKFAPFVGFGGRRRACWPRAPGARGRAAPPPPPGPPPRPAPPSAPSHRLLGYFMVFHKQVSNTSLYRHSVLEFAKYVRQKPYLCLDDANTTYDICFVQTEQSSKMFTNCFCTFFIFK